MVPPRVADVERDDDAFFRTNALILRNPSAFQFPRCVRAVAAVPSPAAARRVGLMLAGAPHGDDALLAIGRAVEAVLNTIRLDVRRAAGCSR